jgi:hypothetical protein
MKRSPACRSACPRMFHRDRSGQALLDSGRLAWAFGPPGFPNPPAAAQQRVQTPSWQPLSASHWSTWSMQVSPVALRGWHVPVSAPSLAGRQ